MRRARSGRAAAPFARLAKTTLLLGAALAAAASASITASIDARARADEPPGGPAAAPAAPAAPGDSAADDPAGDPEEEAPARATLGLAYTGVSDLSPTPDLPYRRGAALYVYPTTQGYKAGLRTGDLLVRIGEQVLDLPPGEVLGRAKALIADLPLDAEAILEVIRSGKVVRVPVRAVRAPPRFDRIRTRAAWLEAPSAPRGGAPGAAPGAAAGAPARVLAQLTEAAGGGSAARVADTLARLRALHERRDPLRLRAVVEAHTRPFEAESVARAIARDAAAPLGLWPWLRSLPGAAPANVAAAATTAKDIAAAATLEEALARIGATLALARAERDRAFARLTDDERRHLAERFGVLGDRLAFTIVLDMDPDAAREAANRQTMDILERVDLRPLGEALALALATVDPAVQKRLAALAGAHPRKAEALVLGADTPGGRVEVAGSGDDVHVAEVAYRFDLGGADRYVDVGGGASWALPVAITVDWAGADRYSATATGKQGAGLFGIGVLVDRAGNDRYQATRWSQGVGVAGAGILIDLAGEDAYEVAELGQGLGLRGLGWLCSGGGPDRFAASRAAQGLGLPGGIGVLRDEGGNDRYVCGGRDPSNYGTPGVFEGWGQGTGLGLRGVASGGVGLLHDLGGRDVYEAGNFAQGGGYFFALGILLEEEGDDSYQGARYAQGYSAHQAVGVFIEREGDDRYTAVDPAAAAIAWDESVAILHDEAGDDEYALAGFCLAAAAHNGFAVFQDDKGNDLYQETPARDGGNDYHGGSSVAFFFDQAGKDRFPDGRGACDRVGWQGTDAFFLQGRPSEMRALLRKGNLFAVAGR